MTGFSNGPAAVWAKGVFHRNAGIISGLAALFIVAEGFTLLSTPSRWWVPVIALAAVSVVILSWSNHRMIIKAAVTLLILAFTASFSMLATVSFTGDAGRSLVVPLSFILGLSLLLLITYMGFDTGASRWNAAQVSLIVAFVASYMLLPAGPMAMMATVVITMIITGCVWMKLAPMWSSRSGGMPSRPDMIEERHTERLATALGDQWHVVVRTDLKHPLHVACKDGDGRLLVLIPLDFSSPLHVSRRHGLTYRGRGVRKYLYSVLAYARAHTSENAITVIEDFYGGSEYFGKIIQLPLPDSQTSHENTVIIDMSGSLKGISDDIEHIMETFDYPRLSGKAIRKAMTVAKTKKKERAEHA